MTHKDVMAMMEEIGLPFAYHHFAEGESPEPPFVVFLYPGSNNFSADGVVYFKVNSLDVELYSDLKDTDLEEKIETVLDEYGLFYQKTEVFIETEKLYEVLYEMEV